MVKQIAGFIQILRCACISTYGFTKTTRIFLQYIAFKVHNSEIFISTRQAALNMAYQDITASNGEIDIVATVTGQVISCYVNNNQRFMEFITFNYSTIKYVTN